jgi:hypothetical protein
MLIATYLGLVCPQSCMLSTCRCITDRFLRTVSVYMCVYTNAQYALIYMLCGHIHTFIYIYISIYLCIFVYIHTHIYSPTHHGVSSVSVHTPYTHTYSNLIHLDMCLPFHMYHESFVFYRVHLACLASLSLSRSLAPPLAPPFLTFSLFAR